MRSLLFAVLLLGSALPPAYGQVGEESLSHLEEVQVIVQSMGLEESSLTESSIKVEAELALREAGIGVYSDPEDAETAAVPTLVVSVFLQRVRRLGYTYVTDLEVNQNVFLMNGENARGATYEVAASKGTTPMDSVSDSVMGSVETKVKTFINDWLSFH